MYELCTKHTTLHVVLDLPKYRSFYYMYGGEYENRTRVHGFAIRCVTTPPTRHPWCENKLCMFSRLRSMMEVARIVSVPELSGSVRRALSPLLGGLSSPCITLVFNQNSGCVVREIHNITAFGDPSCCACANRRGVFCFSVGLWLQNRN